MKKLKVLLCLMLMMSGLSGCRITQAKVCGTNYPVFYLINRIGGNYVNANGFNMVVRGLRATTDFEYEIQMAQVNAGLFNYNTETVFLMTDPKYSYISSSAVRELVSFGADVSKYVPENIVNHIKAKMIGEAK